jgi:hypothetical protein
MPRAAHINTYEALLYPHCSNLQKYILDVKGTLRPFGGCTFREIARGSIEYCEITV